MDVTGRCSTNSLRETPGCSPVGGTVRWDWIHSFWKGGMLAGAILGLFHFSWSVLIVFLLRTGASLLLGHSVDFPRRLIHRKFTVRSGGSVFWSGSGRARARAVRSG